MRNVNGAILRAAPAQCKWQYSAHAPRRLGPGRFISNKQKRFLYIFASSLQILVS
jgi:hypothetical protein